MDLLLRVGYIAILINFLKRKIYILAIFLDQNLKVSLFSSIAESVSPRHVALRDRGPPVGNCTQSNSRISDVILSVGNRTQ